MSDTVGDALSAELKEAMLAERAKKSSIEARGLSVVTTSGGLLTIWFGFATFAGTQGSTARSGTVLALVSTGVVLFALACLLGIACNAPGRYLEVDPMSLHTMTKASIWATSGVEARREFALAYIAAISNWRRLNLIRGWFLMVAILLEVLGVIAVGVDVVVLAAGW